MSSHGSISEWLGSLRAGELARASDLWERYKERLVELAAYRLGASQKATADEDDIALSVFSSLCRGAMAGRLDNVTDRDELWWLLLAITKRKVIDLVRRSSATKRGKGRVFNESEYVSNNGEVGPFSLDYLIGDCPTPDTIAIMEEEVQRLLNVLPTLELATIARHRLEGYSVSEIAVKFSVSQRSIERKLQMIRDAWSKELFHAG